MLSFIEVTAQYSNAVLVAILPHISEFSQKVDLPMPIPITMQQVSRFNCDQRKGEIGGVVFLTNGYMFWYDHGFVSGFEAPDSYYTLQDPNRIPEFYGNLKMNKDEAVAFARASIKKLGYKETAVYADGNPKITIAPRHGTNVIPRYRIEWIEPIADDTAIQIEIDGAKKKLKSMTFLTSNLWREPPKIGVEPKVVPIGQIPDFIKGNPEMEKQFRLLPAPIAATPKNKQALVSAMLVLVSDYAQKLKLPIKLPLTTNDVTSFEGESFEDEVTVKLTSGYRFSYNEGYITQFIAPYAFFSGRIDGQVEDYWNSWNMSEREAIQLARGSIKKLGYSEKQLYFDKKPKIKKPIKIGTHTIPRYLFTWYNETRGKDQEGGLTGEIIVDSATVVEIDAGNKSVKSILTMNKKLARPAPQLEGK